MSSLSEVIKERLRLVDVFPEMVYLFCLFLAWSAMDELLEVRPEKLHLRIDSCYLYAFPDIIKLI